MELNMDSKNTKEITKKRKWWPTQLAALCSSTDSSSLEISDVPPLSKACMRHMPSHLGQYFATTNGKEMWNKIYTILKYYCQEPTDFVMVEDFIGLHCHHFGRIISYHKDFGVHQNMLFASLQEWVDTWFDPMGWMVVRLRKEPNRHLKQSRCFTVSLGKNERKNLEYGFFSSNQEDDSFDDEDSEVCGGNIQLKLPDPPMHLFKDVDWVEREQKYIEVKAARLKVNRSKIFNFAAFASKPFDTLYRLLLYHFPINGLSMKLLPCAFNQNSNNFSQTEIRPEMITNFMADIIRYKEKGPVWSIIRIRMDAPELEINENLLKKLKLTDIYNEAKRNPSNQKGYEQSGEGSSRKELNCQEDVPNISNTVDALLAKDEQERSEKFSEMVIDDVVSMPSPSHSCISRPTLTSSRGRGFSTTPPSRARGQLALRSRVRRVCASALPQGNLFHNSTNHMETSQESQAQSSSISHKEFAASGSKEIQVSHESCSATNNNNNDGADLLSHLPNNLQHLINVLLTMPHARILWKQLGNTPGFEDRAYKLELQETVLKTEFEDLFNLRVDNDLQEITIQLKNPNLFMKMRN